MIPTAFPTQNTCIQAAKTTPAPVPAQVQIHSFPLPTLDNRDLPDSGLVTSAWLDFTDKRVYVTLLTSLGSVGNIAADEGADCRQSVCSDDSATWPDGNRDDFDVLKIPPPTLFTGRGLPLPPTSVFQLRQAAPFGPIPPQT